MGNGHQRALMRAELSKGKGKKSGKPYFQVKFTVGDFTSEPNFIDKIHYDYLQREIGEAAREDFKQGDPEHDEPLDDLDD